MSDDTPRWRYRFENYRRAFSLLREAIEMMDERETSQLEREGIIKRFRYNTELAWKVIKDYLESENFVFEQVTPRAVIRKAFEANLLEDGQTWMDALDARNKMSHTYDFNRFEIVIEDIRKHYLRAFDALHMKLLEISMEKL
ncbi:MAG: nucleotidyltransferase substrate binding protein [Nitrospinae bacterium]|nr:nucleotidyltransferase substrate binding protein [Nitrospinota bacterium]